jgi:hypothetical protein
VVWWESVRFLVASGDGEPAVVWCIVIVARQVELGHGGFGEVVAVGGPVVDEMRFAGTTVLVPPWIAYPGLGRASSGWNMGSGEAYMMVWGAAYLALGADQQQRYQRNWPMPDTAEWNDYWLTEG